MELLIVMHVFFVLPSRTGQEHINSCDGMGFVLHDFVGSTFQLLNEAECTLFGPTAVKEIAAHTPNQLLMSTRPLFATSMRGFGICFNGYKHKGYKKDVKKFIFWIHSLGGRVLRDVTLENQKVSTYEVTE